MNEKQNQIKLVEVIFLLASVSIALLYVLVWGPVYIILSLVYYFCTQTWPELVSPGQIVVVVSVILVFPIYKLEVFLFNKYRDLIKLDKNSN